MFLCRHFCIVLKIFQKMIFMNVSLQNLISQKLPTFSLTHLHELLDYGVIVEKYYLTANKNLTYNFCTNGSSFPWPNFRHYLKITHK